MKQIDRGLPLAVAIGVQFVGLVLALFLTDSLLLGAGILLLSGLASYAVGRLLSQS